MKTVLFLCGGVSEEHEISLISTHCVLQALDRTRFRPLVVGISKKGVWYYAGENAFFDGELRADRIKLKETHPKASIEPFSENGRGTLLVNGVRIEIDVVFPLLHGPFGEDGRLQGLLEMMRVPFVGSGCGASWLAMDKALTKSICERAGIPVCRHWVLSSEAQELNVELLPYPVFVKPARLGSSVGISKVSDKKDLVKAIREAFRHDSKVLIEQAVFGREIECAVLGSKKAAKVALPGEIVPSAKVGWYSYEAKYLMDDGAATLTPAELPNEIAQKAQDLALKAFHLLECDGIARVDFFLEAGTNTLLLSEVNTMPGFTPVSMYPKMWESSGLSYRELVSELIQLAEVKGS